MVRRIAVLLVFVVVGCNAAFTQTVKVNWAQGTPFSTFRTYTWAQSQPPATGAAATFYAQWVKPDVDEQMMKKGFQLASAGQKADLLLAYHVVFQESMDTTTTGTGPAWGWGPGPYWGWGGWGGWGPEMTTTQQDPRTMGILTLDMANSQQQLVWRGQATVENVSNSQKGDESQVQKSVQKMFNQFPPKQKR